MQRFSQFELRQLYAGSRCLVMPLQDVDFQAGVTAILEAMAMARPVIVSHIPGQTDIVVEGETGLYVKPGDPNALRSALLRLLDDEDLGRRMGEAGRRHVERVLSLDHYNTRLGAYLVADQQEVPQ